MKAMAVSKLEVSDLLDLKLLPAWVKEPAARASYERYGAEDRPEQTRGRRPRRSRGKSPNAESSRRGRERATFAEKSRARPPSQRLRRSPFVFCRTRPCSRTWLPRLNRNRWLIRSWLWRGFFWRNPGVTTFA